MSVLASDVVQECTIAELQAGRYPFALAGARWAIVRYPMGHQKIWAETGILWVPALAPPVALHRVWHDRLTELRDKGFGLARWREEFEAFYVPAFREHAAGAPYRAAIAEAAGEAAANGLSVGCWCRGEQPCHRRLVVADIRAALGGAQG